MPYGGEPRLCCCKARHVLIFVSICELIECFWQIIFNADLVTVITGAVDAALESVILYGVVKNQTKPLRISMFISLIALAFDFGVILINPVYFASRLASGYESNDTYPNIFGVKSAEEDRFVIGLITGYSVEIISTLSVAVAVLQFALINRCYAHSKDIDGGILREPRINMMKF